MKVSISKPGVVLKPVVDPWRLLGDLKDQVATLQHEVATVKQGRRSASSRLTRLQTAIEAFAEWYLAKGHRPVAKVQEEVEYLRDRARRK
jgi:hypothetical protein